MIFNLLCSIYYRPFRSTRWWRLLSLWNYINEEKLQNEDNCLWYLNSHLIYGKAEVLEFCPKSPMLDFMVNHSYLFIFVTCISLIIIWILRGIHENVDRKGRSGGPRAHPGHQVVSIFFCFSWIPPKFQFFLPPFSCIPPKIIKKNQWNPGHKNKKIWVVYHEIQHWWYLGQIVFCFTYKYNIQMRTSQILR